MVHSKSGEHDIFNTHALSMAKVGLCVALMFIMFAFVFFTERTARNSAESRLHELKAEFDLAMHKQRDSERLQKDNYDSIILELKRLVRSHKDKIDELRKLLQTERDEINKGRVPPIIKPEECE